MTSLDKLLDEPIYAVAPNIKLELRKLATNKDIRIFLTALCRYSKADWAAFLRTCTIVYNVMSSSMLIKADSELMDEILKTPHIAAFFRRLTESEL